MSDKWRSLATADGESDRAVNQVGEKCDAVLEVVPGYL